LRSLIHSAFVLRTPSLLIMPTYVYETIPQFEGEPTKRFEVRQSMKDAAFTQHPDSGQPVRRVPIGGTGLMGGSGGGSQASSGGGACGTGCGCH
jgi:predicted nucleic acid-binding Zn ribbon protein